MKLNISNSLKKSELFQINPNCAGIDIGAKEIFVSIGDKKVRQFSTYTPDLKKIIKWLKSESIEIAAMESTGVYWIPLYEMLADQGIIPVLANTKNIKNVSGRKTDVSDAEWLCTLLRYGLIAGAFRPKAEILELRGYVRQRSLLIEHRAPHILHIDKALIQMNLRLSNVISDIMGMSGMKIIRAIINGQRDPKVLAMLCHERCKNPTEIIMESLEGHYKEDQVFALKQAVEAYDFYTRQIEDCENRIEQMLKKIAPPVDNLPTKKEKRNASKNAYQFDAWGLAYSLAGADLTKIDGINEQTAVLILSEIGTDMSCWPSEKNFTSWIGLCPDNKVSGGKVLKNRTKRSRSRIKQAFKLAAFALHSSKSALGAYFRKMRAKHGVEKAITATAHKLARLVYRMLKYGEAYVDIGSEEYEKRQKERILKGLRKKAAEHGFDLIKKIAA